MTLDMLDKVLTTMPLARLLNFICVSSQTPPGKTVLLEF